MATGDLSSMQQSLTARLITSTLAGVLNDLHLPTHHHLLKTIYLTDSS
jgi:hypothetical protein